jgi:S-DNA-T family DNA segregation ATPase FtsK/SpoIIIE
MATNREMLKEAIADAKAVKETAIANAKAALEEAFAPQLKSMLSMKLQEMEDMDEMEDKMYEMEDKESMEEAEDKDMMEIDLEELLAELNEEEDMEESLNEAEEEEEDEESEESEEGEEEGEPIELEDMTDEDLKDMIEDVIKDMIASGELEAGHEGEEGEEGMEDMEGEEEEIDLAELLREIEEMDEMEEPIDELFGIKPGAVRRLEKMFPETAAKLMGAKSDEEKKQIFDTELRAEGPFKKSFGSNTQSYRADLGSLEDFFKISSTFKPSLGPDSAAGALGQANEAMKDELDEALSTIEALKSELNEINLLNAKLLYTNKIFKAKNLNESQKVKVLSSFDKANNVGEVKMVFETLNEGIKVSKNIIKENLGSASKTTMTPNVKKPIVESNEAFLRMQKLAGII